MFRTLRALFQHPLLRRRPPEVPRISLTGDGVELRRGAERLSGLRWHEVERVVSYKRDLFTVDEILVAFEYRGVAGEPMTFIVSEECPGFPEFMTALRVAFPTIPEDWYSRVMQPAFATNLTVLFPAISPERDSAPAAG